MTRLHDTPSANLERWRTECCRALRFEPSAFSFFFFSALALNLHVAVPEAPGAAEAVAMVDLACTTQVNQASVKVSCGRRFETNAAPSAIGHVRSTAHERLHCQPSRAPMRARIECCGARALWMTGISNIKTHRVAQC